MATKTSGKSSLLLTRIDELLLPEYRYLTHDDECWFLREYTPRKGYRHGETNNLVSNLKKSVDRRALPEWEYKEQALQQTARELAEALGPRWLTAATLVPMPPCQAISDPLYDDRLVRILKNLSAQRTLDIRELLRQHRSADPAHLSESRGHGRPKPDEIRDNFRVREELCEPVPQFIAILDDVLTTGAHFRAAKDLLGRFLPGVRIIGLFIARVVREDDGLPPF